jgi:serine/threonine-protein phosphatase Stp1
MMAQAADPGPVWQSATLTVAAAHRPVTEDALLDLPEHGVWAVADGMGGHSLGATASRTVIDALSEALLPHGPGWTEAVLAARIATARAALHQVHRHLVAVGQDLTPPGIVGSTVVLLLATPDRATILWIGDSRLYLLRDRALHLVTRDHARAVRWVDPHDPDAPPRLRQVLTQALGRAEPLEIGAVDIALTATDRILLCSDGLYKIFDNLQIAEHLVQPAAVLAEAMRRTLAKDAPADDVTMIAVERAGARGP